MAHHLPCVVLGDGHKLRQIFTNLLSNAIKFTERGQVIWRLYGNRDSDNFWSVQVDVADTGPGIPAEDLARIFDPFVQTSTGAHTAGGTGLGLAISREFACLMGGDITVDSELHKGSCFHVVIRLAEGDLALSSGRGLVRHVVGIRPGQGVFRILIAGQTGEDPKALAQLLNAVGFEARQAQKLDEIMSAFEEWSTHALFVVGAQPERGIEIIRRIKELPRGRRTPVLALIGRHDEAARQRALAAGADDVLGMPARDAEVFEKLWASLGVEYVYVRQDSSGRPAERSALTQRSLRAVLCVAPADLTNGLREATIAGDFDRMLMLIERIAVHDSRAGAALRALADGFEYQQLLDMLPPQGEA
jgi:DNA-binding response OmpR family regulator